MSFWRKKLKWKIYDLFCSGFPNTSVVMRSNTAAAAVVLNDRNNIPSIRLNGSIEDMTYYLLTHITCIRIQNITTCHVQVYNDIEYDKWAFNIFHG